MPIIASKPVLNLEQIRIRISSDLLTEIRAYGDTFGVKNLDDFFNQAAQHILNTDRDWVKLKDKKLT